MSFIKLYKVPLMALAIIIIISPTESFSASEETALFHRGTNISDFERDSDCDCNDPDAMYHKTLRQIINDQGSESLKDFLEDFRPRRICGSDGVFYGVKCEFLCAKATNPDKVDLKAKRKAFCRRKLKSEIYNSKMGQLKSEPQPTHPKLCICPRHYAPVCASNGITYGNRCAFECAKHYLSPDIVIVDKQKCNTNDQTAL